MVALLASLFLATPICGAYEAGAAGHAHEIGLCCTSLHESGATAGAQALAAPGRAGAGFPIPAIAASPWFAGAPYRDEVDPPQAPPRSPSYHARSARILV